MISMFPFFFEAAVELSRLVVAGLRRPAPPVPYIFGRVVLTLRFLSAHFSLQCSYSTTLSFCPLFFDLEPHIRRIARFEIYELSQQVALAHSFCGFCSRSRAAGWSFFFASSAAVLLPHLSFLCLPSGAAVHPTPR